MTPGQAERGRSHLRPRVRREGKAPVFNVSLATPEHALVFQRLAARAARLGVTISSLVVEAVDQYLTRGDHE